MIKKLVIVCVAVFLAAGSMGVMPVGGDLHPPPWRGDEGSTFQEWTFSTDDPTPPPDNFVNPYGDPLLRVDTPYDWYSFFEGQEGVWPLSGEINVYLPNRLEPWPEKWIWIQLTWKPADLCPDPFVPDEPVIGVTPFDFMIMSRTDENLGDTDWVHSVFDIILYPNPPEEWITITGDILVDWLIIDTICIPEPAMIFLLGLGGLALLRKRRT